MTRWIGIAVVVLLLAIAWLAIAKPALFPDHVDVPQLVYLLMALMLVSGVGWGFWRIRMQPGAAVAGVVFWAALIVLIVMVYSWFN